MNRIASTIALAATIAPIAAQRIVASHTLHPTQTVQMLRPAVDTNDDGVDDFVAVVRSHTGSTYGIFVVDGSNGAILRQLGAALPFAPLDVIGFGDGDGDGHGDIAVTHSNTIVYSGATGAVLYTQNQRFLSMCALGDYDGNGSADFAGVWYNNNGQNIVMLLRGENATPFSSLPPISNPHADCILRNAGDVSGDGRDDLAISPEDGATVVLHSVTGAIENFISMPGPNENSRTIETIDLDGDGLREVFVLRQDAIDRIDIHDGATGQLWFGLSAPPGNATNDFARNVCGVGDLDCDGFVDFVSLVPGASGALHAFSGSTGNVLWRFETPLEALGSYLCPLPDIDGDGYSDFVASYGSYNSGGPPGTGWQLVSSLIVAEATDIGGACGGGPFLPQLGMSRPILGQTTTISLLHGPLGTNGVLAFSLQPSWPTYLGASSCSAGFDMGNAMALYLPTEPNWSYSIPLPLVHELAGIPIALQCFYSPTSGALGMDLSNAIWARVGFQ